MCQHKDNDCDITELCRDACVLCANKRVLSRSTNMMMVCLYIISGPWLNAERRVAHNGVHDTQIHCAQKTMADKLGLHSTIQYEI